MVQSAVDHITAKTKMSPEDVREYLAKESPPNRGLQPEQIALAAVWLASEEAQSLTGQAINVCGGKSCPSSYCAAV